MKPDLRSAAFAGACLGFAGFAAFADSARAQNAPPIRHVEPAHSARPAPEASGGDQNNGVELKRIEDQLRTLQQTINNLPNNPVQSPDASSGTTTVRAASPSAAPPVGPSPSAAAPSSLKQGPAIPTPDQFFAFNGEKSPSQTLILLLVSGIMGMVGQGARTVVGLKKLSDTSQTAASQADTFSASRLAVGLMIGFVAGVAGGMTPKVFNATTITSDILFYLASIGYMGVDVIEGFTNTISSSRRAVLTNVAPDPTTVTTPIPESQPPSSHDIASTRSPPPPAHSSNEEINEALQYATDIEDAAQKHGIPAEYICGVGSRESLWGLALRPKGPAGTGDWAPRNGRMPPDGLGWGRGLMQIDYASHPFAQTGDWRDPAANIAYGGDILGQNYDYFRRARYPGVDPLRAAIAAYNCGIGNVEHAIHAGEDVDARTTGRNYSQDVLRRAARFKPYIGSSTLTS
jgi:hypothetical protein